MKYRKWMTLGAALAFCLLRSRFTRPRVILAGSGSSAAENTQNWGAAGIGSCDSGTGSRSPETTAAAPQSPTIVSGQGQSAPGSTGSESSAPVSAGEVTGI